MSRNKRRGKKKKAEAEAQQPPYEQGAPGNRVGDFDFTGMLEALHACAAPPPDDSAPDDAAATTQLACDHKDIRKIVLGLDTVPFLMNRETWQEDNFFVVPYAAMVRVRDAIENTKKSLDAAAAATTPATS